MLSNIKFRCLNIYLTILQDENPKLDYKDLKELLLKKFNFKVSYRELDDYFNSTIYEESLDNQLLTKNLGIFY